MTGIVLAGGKSERMGRNKAFLKVDGIPMIDKVLRTLRGIFPRTMVVTRDPEAYASCDSVIVRDLIDAQGALTGIYSGLFHSSDEHNFITACDMPFLDPALISYMAGLASGYDIVVPVNKGSYEPLHAIYSKALLPIIEQRLHKNQFQIRGIFNEVRVRYIAETEIDRFDPLRQSFRNLNTPDEYEEVTCLDLECRNC